MENRGCTTFGCQGTIKGADAGAASVTDTQMQYEQTAADVIYCTRCGARNGASASFCTACGNPLTVIPPRQTADPQPTYQQPAYQNQGYQNQGYQNQGYQNQGYQNQGYQNQGYQNQGYQNRGYSTYQSQPGGVPDETLARYVGAKQEYYLPKFRQLQAQGKNTSWNWPAFLFAPLWLFYRKMYGYGGAIMAAALVINLMDSAFMSFLAFAGYVVFGIFANSIYKHHLEKRIAQAASVPEAFREQYIAKNSGVSTGAAILAGVGYYILTAFIMSL